MKSKIIKQLIKENFDSLSATGQTLAKFVTDNYQQSMLLSSVELAQAAGVSNTAVIRFAKALGFSGFIEYKNTLKYEYTSTQKVYSYLSLMEPIGENGYISDHFTRILASLEHFTKHFERNILDQFCKAMMTAETIYIMGIGSDEVIVSFLQNYLNVMGLKCIPVYQEGLTLRERLFLIGKNDVLIMSSFPTLTKDERWAAKYAKKRGAVLLAITDAESTASILQPNYYACLSDTPDVFFNSYILPLAFCDALLLRLYELNPKKTSSAMEKYQSMLDDN